MRVIPDDLSFWQHPFLLQSRISCAWRGGDICDPYWLNGGKWLDASTPAPTFTIRFWCPWRILPWVCIRVGKFLIAVGWKAYQVNNPAYLRFTRPEDNYPESIALCFTIQTKWNFKG